jgi:hypothetical protein
MAYLQKSVLCSRFLSLLSVGASSGWALDVEFLLFSRPRLYLDAANAAVVRIDPSALDGTAPLVAVALTNDFSDVAAALRGRTLSVPSPHELAFALPLLAHAIADKGLTPPPAEEWPVASAVASNFLRDCAALARSHRDPVSRVYSFVRAHYPNGGAPALALLAMTLTDVFYFSDGDSTAEFVGAELSNLFATTLLAFLATNEPSEEARDFVAAVLAALLSPFARGAADPRVLSLRFANRRSLILRRSADGAGGDCAALRRKDAALCAAVGCAARLSNATVASGRALTEVAVLFASGEKFRQRPWGEVKEDVARAVWPHEGGGGAVGSAEPEGTMAREVPKTPEPKRREGTCEALASPRRTELKNKQRGKENAPPALVMAVMGLVL